MSRPPEVLLELTLGPPLVGLLSVPGAAAAAARALSAVLVALGLPGEPVVRLDTGPDRPLVATVHGQDCPCPDEWLLRAVRHLRPAAPPPRAGWQGDLLRWQAGATAEDLALLVGLLCRAALLRRPGVLLGAEQARAYAAALPGGGAPDPDGLLPVLGRVLDQGISLGDRAEVARVLAAGLCRGRGPEDLAEDLIGALCEPAVAVRMPRGTLRLLTGAGAEGADVAVLRGGLFDETGLYPALRFWPDEDLSPSSFALRLNHLDGLPRPSLKQGERRALADLGLDLPKDAFFYRPQVEAISPLGAVIVALRVELRERGHGLVHVPLVRGHLEFLRAGAPRLVEALLARLPIESITRVLRALCAEDVSVRDGRAIFERLVDWDLGGGGVDDVAGMVAFVREGLRRQLCYRLARGQRTLPHYQLAPEWGERPVPADLRAALRLRLSRLSPLAVPPVLLTSAAQRPLVREILAPEFPRLAVLADTEVLPESELSRQRIDLIRLIRVPKTHLTKEGACHE